MTTEFTWGNNIHIWFPPLLRAENNFSDVTLVCEDGQKVEAHKVILAASSPFFQMLLTLERQVSSKKILIHSWPLLMNCN